MVDVETRERERRNGRIRFDVTELYSTLHISRHNSNSFSIPFSLFFSLATVFSSVSTRLMRKVFEECTFQCLSLFRKRSKGLDFGLK
ncbi:hypothetical protein VNO80_02799 [Phaseolus coccineus]|uniref:Uncharacterized protein n=1 Tax=Phaseolus coccineus TaxID=3886 RepID=A0AAN9RI90_PHACN